MDTFRDLIEFVCQLRLKYECHDDVVVYTGYNQDEVEDEVACLNRFDHIIVKFGRFIPGQEPHYDEVLGVNLASDNQRGVDYGRLCK